MRVWRNLNLRRTVADKFQWTYRDAPIVPDTVFSLAADGAVVGAAGFMVRQMSLFGADARAAVMSDLVVDPAHRSVLPALKLVRAGREFAETRFDLICAWPNEHAEGVFKRARYKTLGQTVRYARVLRHAGYARRASESDGVPKLVARAIQHDAVARVAGVAVDAKKMAEEAPHVLKAALRFKLEWPNAPDERIDALWQGARVEYPIATARTAAFLRWRYPADRPCDMALLVERRGGAPRAYAIVGRTDDDSFYIHDLFGYHDALSPLLSLLLVSLYRRDGRLVSFRYLGLPTVADVLRDHGFVEREDHRTITVLPGASTAERAAEVMNVSNWHLTDLDEDV